jgi:hypothetical protein
MHPVVDAVLALLARLERRLGAHVDLPFGLSILMVAHLPTEREPVDEPS